MSVPTKASVSEVVEPIYSYELDIPDDVLQAILDLGLEAAPELERALLQVKENPDSHGLSDDESCAPLHALLLLGEIGAERSYGAVLDVLSQPHEALDTWCGDLLLTAGVGALIGCAGHRVAPLAEAFLDEARPLHTRELLGHAIVEVALEDRAERPAAIDALRTRAGQLLALPKKRVDDTMKEHAAILLTQVVDLGAAELEPEVDRLYAAGRVSLEFLEREHVELSEPEDLPPRGTLPEVYERMREAVADMCGPGCGHDHDDDGSDDGLDDGDEDDDEGDDDVVGRHHEAHLGHVHGPDCAHDHGHAGHVHGPHCAHGHEPVVETFRREEKKVGRNDPCPCGSGKKHKKCCGR